MKTLIFLISLVTVVSCQTSKITITQPVVQNQVVRDTTYISDQKALSNWLRSQTQEVRDDFRRDFVFSAGEVKSLVDTLKSVKQ
jgi:hypothetical protein